MTTRTIKETLTRIENTTKLTTEETKKSLEPIKNRHKEKKFSIQKLVKAIQIFI